MRRPSASAIETTTPPRPLRIGPQISTPWRVSSAAAESSAKSPDPRAQISRPRAPSAAAHAATFAAWPPAVKLIVAGVSASGTSGSDGTTTTSRIRSPIEQIERGLRSPPVASTGT